MIVAELMKNADCSRLKMLGFSCCHRVTCPGIGSDLRHQPRSQDQNASLKILIWDEGLFQRTFVSHAHENKKSMADERFAGPCPHSSGPGQCHNPVDRQSPTGGDKCKSPGLSSFIVSFQTRKRTDRAVICCHTSYFRQEAITKAVVRRIMITIILVTLLTFLHSVSSYNYCSVTPYHTLCGYTGGKSSESK